MKRPWELALAIDDAGRLPIFSQIARAVAEDIRRGRLRANDVLPGSRTLAASLGVHRNTVLCAFRELAAEGWITMSPARGTYVSAALPEPVPRRFATQTVMRGAAPARVGFDMGEPVQAYPTPAYPRGTLILGSGVPDLRLVPVAALARAYRRALRSGGGILNYGDPRGHLRLRAALAPMLAALRGLGAAPETVLITRGSQMALDLAARALVGPGDVVAVEALGYRPAWDVLRLAGARVVPIAIDAAGLRVDALRELAARARLRAVYVTPHHQFPTTVVLSAGRRLELLELARLHRFAIIEDDYDHEFHYEGRPVLPLASADTAGVVVYIGTLSKVLAPALRLGFMVAPEPLVERLAALRGFVDRQGDQPLECAVAELIEDGELQRHVRRARRIYQRRRDLLAGLLAAHLGNDLSFRLPAGGIALWVTAAPKIDVDQWAAAALEKGVVIFPSRQFAFQSSGGAGPASRSARLGFASLNESELVLAVERLSAARRRRQSR